MRYLRLQSGVVLLAAMVLYSCSAGRQTTIRRHPPVSKVRRYTPRPTTPKPPVRKETTATADGIASSPYIRSTVVIKKSQPVINVDTRDIMPRQVIDFAELQLGVPYRYGGIDPKKGFDCSGFINYVFDHFGINVPRITYLFTNTGVEVPIEDSRPGDLVLFTGSNPKSGIVGHMGIITENNNGNIEFIHASSSRGIMLSGMNTYFVERFVKVNRIFK